MPAELLDGARVIPMVRPAQEPPGVTAHRVRGLHVAVTGSGPDVLLIHGTAACGDSWQRIAPPLARRCRVLVPDLPGHGRSARPAGGYSLATTAATLTRMLGDLEAEPRLLVGHSAGAAVAAAMMLGGEVAPAGLVAIAPAMLGFSGGRQRLFSALAGMLALNPLIPRLVSWRARDRAAVERLLRGIGTDLDTAGLDRYADLFRNPDHVAAVLAMMASWDLSDLERRLAMLGDAVLLIAGDNDRAVPPREVDRLQRYLPRAARVDLPAAGHLPHEERPEAVLAAIRSWAAGRGVTV